ncbi:MAG TPA: hypothetical protein H9915_02865 [Candidatus Gemmiger faecigallinarum]|nr:hypothetical protein [Candidatus Gemmiger faecigallinarum]
MNEEGKERPAAPRRRRKAKAVGREEIEALWAAVMRDETAAPKDRMHAAELCARAIEAKEEGQEEKTAGRDAAAGRLDEVLQALWGCRAGEWDG